MPRPPGNSVPPASRPAMSPHPARSSPVHHSNSPGLKAVSCPPQRASAYEHPDAAGYYSRAGSSPDNLLSGSANRRREREMAAHAMGRREQWSNNPQTEAAKTRQEQRAIDKAYATNVGWEPGAVFEHPASRRVQDEREGEEINVQVAVLLPGIHAQPLYQQSRQK